MERRSVAKLLLTSCLSGCFSELYLPVAESGHRAPRTRAEQKSLPGPKQAEVRTWSCCWWSEWSVPPQLAWAVDLTKQNKQLLSEPVRRVNSGSLSGEMAQFQMYMWTWRCTHQLSAIYKWDGNFTVGQHSQLFPEFIDPTQEDLTMCVQA